MIETSRIRNPERFRHPEILGLPAYENPLLNPETGEVESAFSPLPGEEVPPADILAEIFPPNGDEGLAAPDTIDGVRALARTVDAFYDRASTRTRNRLNVYTTAIETQEDKLDPPLGRYFRTFKKEIGAAVEAPESFYELMTVLFDRTSKHQKPSPEQYDQLSKLFCSDPTTIALFHLFITTGMNQGLIRKDWEKDRRRSFYPGLNQRIQREGQVFGDPSIWFINSVTNIEETFHRAEAVNQESQIDYKIKSSQHLTHSVLGGMAWTMFIRNFPDDSFMQTYDYDGLNNLLGRMRTPLNGSAAGPLLNRFALDIARAVSVKLFEKGIVTRKGLDGVYSRPKEAITVLEAALKHGDGLLWKQQEFIDAASGYLGHDAVLDEPHFEQYTKALGVEFPGL